MAGMVHVAIFALNSESDHPTDESTVFPLTILIKNDDDGNFFVIPVRPTGCLGIYWKFFRSRIPADTSHSSPSSNGSPQG